MCVLLPPNAKTQQSRQTPESFKLLTTLYLLYDITLPAPHDYLAFSDNSLILECSQDVYGKGNPDPYSCVTLGKEGPNHRSTKLGSKRFTL